MSHYIVRVQDITSGGRDLNMTSDSEEWLKKIVIEAIPAKIISFTANLTARLTKMDRSIEIIGGVFIDSEIECDKCLEPFTYDEQVSFRMLLEPMPKGKNKKDLFNEEEGEDMNEFIDFSYYDGDEIDVGDLIRQHIVMSQPMRHICSEECKGLCQNCGTNLNEGDCDCKDLNENSPFAVLKNLKK